MQKWMGVCHLVPVCVRERERDRRRFGVEVGV